MLYLIRHSQDIFQDNPGLLAVEKYAKLTDKQMKFVLIFCDPSRDNPVKTLSGRERRERSAILAGYPLEADGKRLAKNARELVYAKVASVEEAIEEFKLNHYNERHHNREALKKQIAEIRDFLASDKRIPLIEKGKIVLNSKGEEVFITDQKALKLAVELGVKLPDLEKALEELESREPEDTKFEGATFSSADLPEDYFDEGGSQDLPTIEIYNLQKIKNKE